MMMSGMGADIALPMERPLLAPVVKTPLAELVLAGAEDDLDTAGLFDQVVVDKQRLRDCLQRALGQRPQITLHELLETDPLQHGLAELVAWLELAHAADGTQGPRVVVDEAVEEPIRWRASDAGGEPLHRLARLPRVIFRR